MKGFDTKKKTTDGFESVVFHTGLHGDFCGPAVLAERLDTERVDEFVLVEFEKRAEGHSNLTFPSKTVLYFSLTLNTALW